MTEEIHIAGSTALGRFVINMNFIWIMFLSWAYPILVNMLANKRLQRIHPSHKLQRMNVKRKRNAFLNMWNYFNIVVLWLDILVIAYCHARSGNCVLIYESETSHTDGLAMLIVNIVIYYRFTFSTGYIRTNIWTSLIFWVQLSMMKSHDWFTEM